jgi:Arc/MetJ family transcription regulator
MRLTIELDDKELQEVQEATGIQKKSPAVQKAVQGYLDAVHRTRFLQRVAEGKTQYGMTNDELEAAATYDTD